MQNENLKLTLSSDQNKLFKDWIASKYGKEEAERQVIIQTIISPFIDSSGTTVMTLADNIGELLKDNDRDVRLNAITYLLGRQFDMVPIKDIVECLKDEDEEVREAAIWTLWNFEIRISDAMIRKILAMLHDKNSYVRDAAIQVLSEFRDRLDTDAIEDIISCMKDIDNKVQISALTAVAKIFDFSSASDDRNYRLLLDLFNMMQDDVLRQYAHEVLINICGKLSRATMHKLAGLLQTVAPDIRDDVTEFLSSIGQNDLVYSHMPEYGSRRRDEHKHLHDGKVISAAPPKFSELLEEVTAIITR